MTLNLGRSEHMSSDSGSRQVKAVLLERVPTTLLLIGTTMLINFFLSLYLGLVLSCRYGSLMDKLTSCPGADILCAGVVVWHIFNPALCRRSEVASVGRHGGCPAAGG